MIQNLKKTGFLVLICFGLLGATIAPIVTGQCNIATVLFNSLSTWVQTEQITAQTLCPGVKQPCCEEETYKAMNTWWTDDGPLSMDRLWKDKITRIFMEIQEIHQKFYDKIIKEAKAQIAKTNPNIDCKKASELVLDLKELEADQEAFTFIQESSKQCWQYTIDFLRGLACGVCDASSVEFITTRN